MGDGDKSACSQMRDFPFAQWPVYPAPKAQAD